MNIFQFLDKHFWALWWLIAISCAFLGAPSKVIVREKND